MFRIKFYAWLQTKQVSGTVSIHVYVHLCMCVCVCVCVYTHIHTHRINIMTLMTHSTIAMHIVLRYSMADCVAKAGIGIHRFNTLSEYEEFICFILPRYFWRSFATKCEHLSFYSSSLPAYYNTFLTGGKPVFIHKTGKYLHGPVKSLAN